MIKNKISIIITIYNAEKYIVKCLLSICKQSYKDFEIILVNDATLDRSVELAQEFLDTQPSIDYQWVHHEKNFGASTARNSGMDASKGDYLFFIDNDDELAHENALKIFVEHISEGYDFITANCQLTYNEGEPATSNLCVPTNGCVSFTNNEILEALLDKKIPIVLWNKLYDKNFLLRHNIRFQEDLLHEDEWWTFQVCTFANKALIINEITYNYFKENSNSITNNYSLKNSEHLLKAMINIIHFSDEKKIYEKVNPRKLIRYINNIVIYALSRDIILEQPKAWRKNYRKIRETYHKSALITMVKKYRYSPFFSYHLYIESHKNYSFFGAKIYQKLLKRFKVF